MKYIIVIIVFLLLCLNIGLLISPFIAKSSNIDVKEISYEGHTYLVFTQSRTGQISVEHSPDCFCFTDIIDYETE